MLLAGNEAVKHLLGNILETVSRESKAGFEDMGSLPEPPAMAILTISSAERFKGNQGKTWM